MSATGLNLEAIQKAIVQHNGNCGSPILAERQRSMALADLLATVPPGHRTEPWTWEDEERDIQSRLCLCCGQPGHYQKTVEAHIAAHGLTEGVCVGDNGRLHDGHHRVVAAITLRIERVPLETRDEADSRWLRDHGTFVWELRQFGDVHPGEAWAHVQNFRQAARDFVAREAVGQHGSTLAPSIEESRPLVTEPIAA